MKTITKGIVEGTAISLLIANGATTTLEVKEELRNNGYWALQSEVSAFMVEIATEEGWDAYNSNGYRTYSFLSTNTNSQVQPSRNGTLYAGLTDDEQAWIAYCSDSYEKPQVFDASLSRDQARYAYSKGISMNKDSVCACRASNYKG